MVLDTRIAPLSIDERFALLYSWYPRVRPYVVALVGAQDAEDVLQQTYLNVWRVLPHTEIITVTWLRRIATNAALDHLRRIATRTRHTSVASLDDAAEFLEAASRFSPDVVMLGREELCEALASQVALLAPEEARTLLLVATLGKEKAAARLHKSERAVSESVYRSRQKMKRSAAG